MALAEENNEVEIQREEMGRVLILAESPDCNIEMRVRVWFRVLSCLALSMRLQQH